MASSSVAVTASAVGMCARLKAISAAEMTSETLSLAKQVASAVATLALLLAASAVTRGGQATNTRCLRAQHALGIRYHASTLTVMRSSAVRAALVAVTSVWVQVVFAAEVLATALSVGQTANVVATPARQLAANAAAPRGSTIQ
jgi:hypothetical protein